MKKYLSLLLGIIALGKVIYSFIDVTSHELFGISVHIWLYRLIWAVFGLIFFYNFIVTYQREKKH